MPPVSVWRCMTYVAWKIDTANDGIQPCSLQKQMVVSLCACVCVCWCRCVCVCFCFMRGQNPAQANIDRRRLTDCRVACAYYRARERALWVGVFLQLVTAFFWGQDLLFTFVLLIKQAETAVFQSSKEHFICKQWTAYHPFVDMDLKGNHVNIRASYISVTDKAPSTLQGSF